MSESRVDLIKAWLDANAAAIEQPQGSLLIDWGENDITFKATRLDRFSTRRSERIAS